MQKLKEIWKDKYTMTFLSLGLSLVCTMGIAIYNGVVGIMNQSIWNGSICVYYLLVILLRGIVFLCEMKAKRTNDDVLRKRAYIASFIVLLVINLALIAPIALMIQNKRVVTMGLIPAIANAAYTFFCFSKSIYNIIKFKDNENLLVKQSKLIGHVCSLVSLITLQNTLIHVKETTNESMTTFCCVTSGVLLLAILGITIGSFYKNIIKNKKNAK